MNAGLIDMDKEAIKRQLDAIQREYAKKKKKLERSIKASKVKAHVKQKLREQNTDCHSPWNGSDIKNNAIRNKDGSQKRCSVSFRLDDVKTVPSVSQNASCLQTPPKLEFGVEENNTTKTGPILNSTYTVSEGKLLKRYQKENDSDEDDNEVILPSQVSVRGGILKTKRAGIDGAEKREMFPDVYEGSENVIPPTQENFRVKKGLTKRMSIGTVYVNASEQNKTSTACKCRKSKRRATISPVLKVNEDQTESNEIAKNTENVTNVEENKRQSKRRVTISPVLKVDVYDTASTLAKHSDNEANLKIKPVHKSSNNDSPSVKITENNFQITSSEAKGEVFEAGMSCKTRKENMQESDNSESELNVAHIEMDLVDKVETSNENLIAIPKFECPRKMTIESERETDVVMHKSYENSYTESSNIESDYDLSIGVAESVKVRRRQKKSNMIDSLELSCSELDSDWCLDVASQEMIYNKLKNKLQKKRKCMNSDGKDTTAKRSLKRVKANLNQILFPLPAKSFLTDLQYFSLPEDVFGSLKAEKKKSVSATSSLIKSNYRSHSQPVLKRNELDLEDSYSAVSFEVNSKVSRNASRVSDGASIIIGGSNDIQHSPKQEHCKPDILKLQSDTAKENQVSTKKKRIVNRCFNLHSSPAQGTALSQSSELEIHPCSSQASTATPPGQAYVPPETSAYMTIHTVDSNVIGDGDVVNCSHCVQSSISNPKSLACGVYEPSSDEHQCIVVAVSNDAQIVMWSFGSNGHFEHLYTWACKQNEEYHGLHLLNSKKSVMLLATGKFGNYSLRLHRWSDAGSVEYDFVTQPKSGTVPVVCQIGPQDVCIAVDNIVTKFILSDHAATPGSQLESVAGVLTSLTCIVGIPQGLLGIEKNTAHVWNHSLGFLLKSIDLGTVSPDCLHYCFNAVNECGILFLTLLTRDLHQNDVSPGCLVAVNPNTHKTAVLFQYERNRSLNACMLGYQMEVGYVCGISEDGSLFLWDSYSGKLCGNRTASMKTGVAAFTQDGKILITGDINGDLHKYLI